MPDEIVIRTMKDDIAEMNESPAPVPPVSKVLVPHIKPKKGVTPPVFSLPKEGESTPTKKYMHILLGIMYIALFGVVVSGGIYAYMQWGTVKRTENTPPQETAFFELIPKEALAVVDYNSTTEEKRTAIQQMMGDSRFPIGITSRVSYVLMPGNPKPFLILEKNELSKEYVAQQREEQILEKNGWYVMHADNIEQYSAALSNGAIDEKSLLVDSIESSNYLIRYAMSAAFVRQQFQALASSATGFSSSDDLVFYVTQSANNGVLLASAQIAGDPPGEGVVNDTAELLSLIPSDIHFGQVGLNFAEKIASLEPESSRLDGSVLAQPAVRQFISLFTTPYVLFERKGSDGVLDLGFVVALPSSLQKKLRIGEPIVEQALPALIPLILGKRLDVQFAFNDGLYNTVPLRYVNMNGQTQTIDYTVGDNFLLVSSSREGMSALVDTSFTKKQGLSTEDPFKTLGEKAEAILKNKTFIAGSIMDPALLSVLPTLGNEGKVPVIISSGKTSTGIEIQAVLLTK